ncbi:DUF192 domain-containing protein [Patescibacteria group bacterium]
MSKKYLILLIVFLIGILSIIAFKALSTKEQLQQSKNMLQVGKCKFNIETAKTAEEKKQGLSGRQSLDQYTGIMFYYDQPKIYSFWMKDMNFPLDFVWINENTIVDLSENIPPPTNSNNIPRASSRKPVNKVLEINAGMIKNCEINIGSEIEKTY